MNYIKINSVGFSNTSIAICHSIRLKIRIDLQEKNRGDQVDLSAQADAKYLAFLLLESMYSTGQINAEMYERILRKKKEYVNSLKKKAGGL